MMPCGCSMHEELEGKALYMCLCTHVDGCRFTCVHAYVLCTCAYVCLVWVMLEVLSMWVCSVHARACVQVCVCVCEWVYAHVCVWMCVYAHAHMCAADARVCAPMHCGVVGVAVVLGEQAEWCWC